ncbi:YbaK prolyl-tRNA synthetase associated domain-containing protein [Companilactobacillus kimchiensis]|uniref:YbaK prolyl-tRNA synthetase associated domain-containing protein n=1 Tax=Companilactobacillus kimchiensis TaxID=993692 RepID=A0A0R2LDR3_9LACO|nr:prolyl-tRNA synthetase associated domain-containing protein [Companilactobacillus kimchiensis]KRO00047.1 YbaK prolyl-tRNA synthetase associated domain-containing protein [Companilactobacillus kimchiensis]
MPFDIVEHPAVFTTDVADEYIKGKVGVRTKSLFLTDKKKHNFYLVFMDDDKRLDMKHFAEIVGEKHVKFASEVSLMEKLGLKPGVVSIFGLMNNKEKDVQVYFEKDIVGDIPLTFHPNDNTKTIFVGMTGLEKFLKDLGFEYQIITM